MGKDLALYESKLLLAEILKHFRFELAEKAYREEIARPEWRKNVLTLSGAPVYKQGLTIFFRDQLKLKMFRR